MGGKAPDEVSGYDVIDRTGQTIGARAVPTQSVYAIPKLRRTAEVNSSSSSGFERKANAPT